MRARKIWLIWGVLVALAVVIWHGEVRRSDEISAQSVRETRRLLPAPIEEIGVVELLVKATMHRFERAANGQWFYHGVHDATLAGHEHQINPAQADTIANALAGFGRLQPEQQIPLKGGADDYGIMRPDIFIIVYRTGADTPLARYAAGNVTPDGYSRYLLPVGSATIVTVPEFHLTNLLDLIAAMQAPAAAGPTPLPATGAAAPATPPS